LLQWGHAVLHSTCNCHLFGVTGIGLAEYGQNRLRIGGAADARFA
jgi:hypothetical protein